MKFFFTLKWLKSIENWISWITNVFFIRLTPIPCLQPKRTLIVFHTVTEKVTPKRGLNLPLPEKVSAALKKDETLKPPMVQTDVWMLASEPENRWRDFRAKMFPRFFSGEP